MNFCCSLPPICTRAISVEAGVDERLDLLDVLLDVGAARELLGDLVGGDELGGAFEGSPGWAGRR